MIEGEHEEADERHSDRTTEKSEQHPLDCSRSARARLREQRGRRQEDSEADPALECQLRRDRPQRGGKHDDDKCRRSAKRLHSDPRTRPALERPAEREPEEREKHHPAQRFPKVVEQAHGTRAARKGDDGPRRSEGHRRARDTADQGAQDMRKLNRRLYALRARARANANSAGKRKNSP